MSNHCNRDRIKPFPFQENNNRLDYKNILKKDNPRFLCLKQTIPAVSHAGEAKKDEAGARRGGLLGTMWGQNPCSVFKHALFKIFVFILFSWVAPPPTFLWWEKHHVVKNFIALCFIRVVFISDGLTWWATDSGWQAVRLRFRNVPEGYSTSLMREELEVSERQLLSAFFFCCFS